MTTNKTPENPEAPKNQFEIVRLSDDDLKKFILDFVNGKVFILQDIPQNQSHLAQMVFLPLALGLFVDVPKEMLSEIGTIYEYHDKAMPRSANGFPIFPSCRVMWKGDWERALPAIEKLIAQRKTEKEDIQL